MSWREQTRNRRLADIVLALVLCAAVAATVLNEGMPRGFVLTVAVLVLPWAGWRFYDAIGDLRYLRRFRAELDAEEAVEG